MISFCIHQDISAGVSPANNTAFNNTPTSYSDDRWLCYTWSKANYQINYCSMAYCSGNPSCGSPWGRTTVIVFQGIIQHFWERPMVLLLNLLLRSSCSCLLCLLHILIRHFPLRSKIVLMILRTYCLIVVSLRIAPTGAQSG